jgi:hypothetical protein
LKFDDDVDKPIDAGGMRAPSRGSSRKSAVGEASRDSKAGAPETSSRDSKAGGSKAGAPDLAKQSSVDSVSAHGSHTVHALPSAVRALFS